MAAEIYVSGPLAVKLGTDILGYTDADGARIVTDMGADPVFSSEFGPHVPTDYVYLGKLAKVSMTLSKYDRDVLVDAMSTDRGGTDIGDLGSLGALLKGTAAILVLEATIGATGPTYTFPVAFVAEDDVEFSQIGVSPELCQITFTALPAENTAASPVWTET